MSSRFEVTYHIVAPSLEEAQGRAQNIAVEQTIEIPRELAPAGYINDVVLGKIVAVTQLEHNLFCAKISYSPDLVGTDFAQLLNVMFGNSSLQPGLKVVGITPDDQLADRFPGARFGSAGIRALTGRKNGSLVCPVIKPQGASAKNLAELAYNMARAGADIVKEDHGLADQDFAPFKDRLAATVSAVSQANSERAKEGNLTRALYFVSLGGHGDRLVKMAHFAKQAGADGVLIIPGLYGFGAINTLAADEDFALPIMAHPAHLGPYVLSPDTGYSFSMMFGTLMRMAGADISIFPNAGGRFGFSQAQCSEIATACADTNGFAKPILPSPGGGMTIERMPEMMKIYGSDCLYLMGGGLLKHGKNIGNAIKEMRTALN